MGLEAGTTIASLDVTWPLSGDYIQEGDNHLRLIKSVLKAQFPGAALGGFAVPITASEAEINYLSGVTSNIQAQINSLSSISGWVVPSGTVMLFFQAAPPTGWTQVAANDNHMLRIVSGTGGGVGGTDSPISFSTSHNHSTPDHVLTLAEIPAHNHSIASRSNNNGGNGYVEDADASGTARTMSTGSSGSGNAHNHGNTSTDGVTFTPKYANVITASRD